MADVGANSDRTLGAAVDLQGMPVKLALMQFVVLEDIRSTLKEISKGDIPLLPH